MVVKISVLTTIDPLMMSSRGFRGWLRDVNDDDVEYTVSVTQ